MTDTPQIPQARPLVTFALFAYNQEKFIREAVEGAFAQTYQPLEIILSDDCSSDRTFEIMQEMAAAYDGPHEVRVRKNIVNTGTLAHIQNVTASTSGKLIVLAAGDDISRQNRVERLYASWKCHGSWAVYSDFAEIDHNGLITADHKRNDFISSPSYRLKSYMRGNVKENSIVHGATSAYDRSVFEYLILPEDSYILSEDGALSLLLHILEKDVSRVCEPLVEYRKHDGSLTNPTGRRLSWRDLIVAESKISTFALSQSNRCKFIINSHRLFNRDAEARINVELIQQDYNNHRIIANWWNLNLLRRLIAIKKMDPPSAAWAFPRLVPQNVFLTLKYARELFRKD